MKQRLLTVYINFMYELQVILSNETWHGSTNIMTYDVTLILDFFLIIFQEHGQL